MFNLHSVEIRGAPIDGMMDCVADAPESPGDPYNLQDESDLTCATMSSKVGRRIRNAEAGPSVSFYQHIRPVSDR